MKIKWKNIKQNARKRESLRRKAQIKTGGGKLTPMEHRIVDSVLYADVVLKLGQSATGNSARFDSDAENLPPPPTKRLSNVIAESEGSQSSFEFEDSMSNPSTSKSIFTRSVQIDDDDSHDAVRKTPLQRRIPTTRHERDEPIEIDEEDDNSLIGDANPKPPSKRTISRSKSVSNSSDSISKVTTARNTRDVRAQAQLQLSEFLIKNNENNELHSQLLRQQIEHEEKAKEYADFQLRKHKAEAEKAEFELKKAQIDAQLAETLMQIEVKKAQTLADMQIEAQRRQLGL